MPCAIRSLIATAWPVSSVVTICRHARLLCRYCSIAIDASWRTKSLSRSGLPRQPATVRASERAEARPLLRPRPGQKWIALAASPSRNPNVPGVVAVGAKIWAVKRGRCTMSSRKQVTAVRFSSATPNMRRPSSTRPHSGELRSSAGRK